MRISADHPSARRAVRASQFSSQSNDATVWSWMVPSAITPTTLTANMTAFLPSRRESIWIQTQSLSESWSRRVSRPMIGECSCWQSNPK